MSNNSQDKKAIKKFNIKQKIYAIGVGTIIAILLVKVLTFYSIQRIIEYDKLASQVSKVVILSQSLNQLRVDFMMNESINPEFFKNGKSKIVDEFANKKEAIDSILHSLATNKIIKKKGLDFEVRNLQSGINDFENQFSTLTANLYNRGFKDFGNVGVMREQAHELTEAFNDVNNYYLLSYLLTLRKHEKDFIIRKDLKYQERFGNTYLILKKEIQQDTATIDSTRKPVLLKALDNYFLAFKEMTRQDIVIGLSNNEGINGKLERSFNSIQPVMTLINTKVSLLEKQMVTSLYILITFLFLLLLFLIIIMSTRITRSITRPIFGLKNYIEKMSTGELPKSDIGVKEHDEIGEMARHLNNFIDRLKKTVNFADDIGKGKLDTKFEKISENDSLGEALLNMRDSLTRANKETEERKIVEEQQNWAAKGLAQFAEILRKNNDNLEELSYQIISNLVKFLDASQGGIFLVNDDDENDKHIELKSSFAFDRRKYIEKRLEFGEGLVGSAILEKETVYLTKLPEEYSDISSGLGETSPTALLIVPLIMNDEVYGALEIASFNEFMPHQREFVENAGESIASTVSTVKVNLQTNLLLEETKTQSARIKEAEEEMRQNMEEMQATQEESSRREAEMSILVEAVNKAVGVIEYNKDGKIQTANEVFCKMVGYRQDELKGQHHSIYFENKNITNSVNYQLFWDKMKKNETYENVFRRMTKKDREVYMNMIAKPFFDEHGNLVKVVELDFDITKLKLQEALLKEQTMINMVAEEEYEKKIKTLEKELEESKKQLQEHMKARG